MFDGESVKVVPVNAVLAPREPEGHQVALFNPSQDGDLADAAMPGDGAGGKILRAGFFHVRFQASPPVRGHGGQDTRLEMPAFSGLTGVGYTVHAINLVDELAGNNCEPWKLQPNHKRPGKIYKIVTLSRD